MLMKSAPNNVSEQHYELSQIADYIAWKWGCRCIGNEVDGCSGKDPFGRNKASKTCIDAIGIKSGWFHHYNDLDPEIKVYGFEAKVSLSDFRAGFCSACEYTYIIAPTGVIPTTDLPHNIGLIEANLNNYSIEEKINHPLRVMGIHVSKVARRNIDNFSASHWTKEQAEEQYKIWAWNMMIRIARRQTINSLFYNSAIKIERATIKNEYKKH